MFDIRTLILNHSIR